MNPSNRDATVKFRQLNIPRLPAYVAVWTNRGEMIKPLRIIPDNGTPGTQISMVVYRDKKVCGDMITAGH